MVPMLRIYRQERLKHEKCRNVKSKAPCTNCCCEYLHLYLCFVLVLVIAGLGVWLLGNIENGSFLDFNIFTKSNGSSEENYENATASLKKLLKADSLRFNVPLLNRIDISANIMMFRNLVDVLDCDKNNKTTWVFESPGGGFPGHACGIPKHTQPLLYLC